MQNGIPSQESEVILTDRNSAAQVPDAPSAQSFQNWGSQLLAAHVAIWEWDLTTNRVYFSPEYRRQLGVGEAELTNGLSEWEARLHPEDRKRVTQGLRSYLANPGPCYEAAYRLGCKDTTYRWMLLRAEVIRDPQSRPCRILGYQLDISEQRKRGEDQARLAAIVESSEDAIISKCLEGIVTSWNEGARRLFGYSAEEMLGQSVSRIIPAERSEEEVQILARLWRGERVEHYETVRRHKDGRMVDVSLSISPIRDPQRAHHRGVQDRP
jgi:PAS domain S-box-containing protein